MKELSYLDLSPISGLKILVLDKNYTRYDFEVTRFLTVMVLV